jgi:hypothetical protein
MKNKIIAILLLGLVVSCTKENTTPIVTINGDWYDSKTESKRFFKETFNTADSTRTLRVLQGANKGTVKQSKFYLLPLNRMSIGGVEYSYEIDLNHLRYSNTLFYR